MHGRLHYFAPQINVPCVAIWARTTTHHLLILMKTVTQMARHWYCSVIETCDLMEPRLESVYPTFVATIYLPHEGVVDSCYLVCIRWGQREKYTFSRYILCRAYGNATYWWWHIENLFAKKYIHKSLWKFLSIGRNYHKTICGGQHRWIMFYSPSWERISPQVNRIL